MSLKEFTKKVTKHAISSLKDNALATTITAVCKGYTAAYYNKLNDSVAGSKDVSVEAKDFDFTGISGIVGDCGKD